MQIRKACEADIKELTAIYNYEITHGTATFDCEEKTIEDRLCWLHAHNQGNHPLLVCEVYTSALVLLSGAVFQKLRRNLGSIFRLIFTQ